MSAIDNIERKNDIIRKTFKENEELLLAMRAVMLALGATDAQKELVHATFADEAVFEAVKEKFYPVLTSNSPIGMLADAWLGAEKMVHEKDIQSIRQSIFYKDGALKLTKVALDLLKKDVEHTELSEIMDYNPLTDDDLGIKLLTRNMYIRHIENQLFALQTIAESKTTEDESATAKKNLQNSSK